jgi:hypothetical protein
MWTVPHWFRCPLPAARCDGGRCPPPPLVWARDLSAARALSGKLCRNCSPCVATTMQAVLQEAHCSCGAVPCVRPEAADCRAECPGVRRQWCVKRNARDVHAPLPWCARSLADAPRRHRLATFSCCVTVVYDDRVVTCVTVGRQAADVGRYAMRSWAARAFFCTRPLQRCQPRLPTSRTRSGWVALRKPPRRSTWCARRPSFVFSLPPAVQWGLAAPPPPHTHSCFPA